MVLNQMVEEKHVVMVRRLYMEKQKKKGADK
jgi:hypothetical protein